MGTTCSAGAQATTQCVADTYQPYLGGATCKTCDPNASPRYTSADGAAYCTVLVVQSQCDNGARRGRGWCRGRG